MPSPAGTILIVVAPSGAGKTSLVRALMDARERIRHSVSYTTRPPRQGERDGEDYCFISEAEFRKRRIAGEFLEWAEVHGNLYGTSRQWIDGQIAIGADIVKQKMAENNGGYRAVKFGYTDDRVYNKLTTDHPIDLVRYQLANCYMGRAGLINSGGAAGENDLQESVRTAVINKRAGGMGLILGRKAFKKSMKEGVALINAVQDTYLDKKVTIA